MSTSATTPPASNLSDLPAIPAAVVKDGNITGQGAPLPTLGCHGMRVLIAESDEVLRQAIVDRLIDLGYIVNAAGNVELALRLAANADVIVWSVQLVDSPQRNAHTCVRELKTRSDTAHIPVMILGDDHEPQNHARAVAFGAHDLIDRHAVDTELPLRLRTFARFMSVLRRPIQRWAFERALEVEMRVASA